LHCVISPVKEIVLAERTSQAEAIGLFITFELGKRVGRPAELGPQTEWPVTTAAAYHLQVLSDARSPAALQLLGYASAAQRAAGVSRLVLHAALAALRLAAAAAASKNAPAASAESAWGLMR